jgi:murein DD-endopeptidase MepM/ murein hydrolase activator NlpD
LSRKEPNDLPVRGIWESRSLSLAFVVGMTALLAGVGYTLMVKRTPEKWPAGFPAPMLRALPLPPGPTLPRIREIVGIFSARQTITDVLTSHGVSKEEVHHFVECASSVYNLAKVVASRPYWLHFTADGRFHEFRYPVDDERYLTVYRKGEEFVPVMKPFPYKTVVEPVSGSIEESLIGAVMEGGEQEQLALELAGIFMWDIDFYTDIQSGDSFRILVEKKYLNGKFIKYGAIQAASITNQDKTVSGFLYVDKSGRSGYYDREGKSLRKSFLKSPLKFGRISSRFSHARRHPILKVVRPHLGVDYAAPTGTPVVAVGAGTVEMAGRNGAGGNTVQLRHTGNYQTMYLHLSRIAVRRGARVDQGQVIGYVGATGLATGPHLDFRVRQRGRFVNPARVVFPPQPPVPQDELASFHRVRAEFQSRLDQLQF